MSDRTADLEKLGSRKPLSTRWKRRVAVVASMALAVGGFSAGAILGLPQAQAAAWTVDAPGVDTVGASQAPNPASLGRVVASNSNLTAKAIPGVDDSALYGIDGSGATVGNVAAISTVDTSRIQQFAVGAASSTTYTPEQITLAVDSGKGNGQEGFYTWYRGPRPTSAVPDSNHFELWYYAPGDTSPSKVYFVPDMGYFNFSSDAWSSGGGVVDQMTGLIYFKMGFSEFIGPQGMMRISAFDPSSMSTYWSGQIKPASAADDLWKGVISADTTAPGYVAPGMAVMSSGDIILLVRGTDVTIPANSPINTTGHDVAAGSAGVSFLVRVHPSLDNGDWTYSVMKMVTQDPTDTSGKTLEGIQWGMAFSGGKIYAQTGQSLFAIDPGTGYWKYVGQVNSGGTVPPQAPTYVFTALASAQTAVSVTGYVGYGTSNSPVAGATVAVYEKRGSASPVLIGSTVTDGNGEYSYVVPDTDTSGSVSYVVRLVQPKVGGDSAVITGYSMVSSTALGYENSVTMHCADGSTINGTGTGAAVSGACQGIFNDPALESLGATVDPTTFGAYAVVTMRNEWSNPEVDFTLDTKVEAAPVITSPSDGAALTSSTVPVSGTGEAGATVSVKEGGVVLCTATVQPSGSWTCNATLSDGPHTLVASQDDGAGHVSADSAPVHVTVDTKVEAAPVITSPSDGAALTSSTVPVSGTGEAGATVSVKEGGVVLCTATVQPSGSWTCNATLSDGPHTLVASQDDGAGHVSADSAPVHVTVDTFVGVFSAANSTFACDPAVISPDPSKTDWVVANGTSAYVCTVTAKDQANNLMPGLSLTGFSFDIPTAVTKSAVTTDGQGHYNVSFTATVADASYTASAAYDATKVGVPTIVAPIPFQAGAPTPGPIPGCTNPTRDGTNISAVPSTLTVGQTSTVTQLVTDANCNPVEGAVVTFTSTNQTPAGTAVVTTVIGTTGPDGIATATLKDTTAQTDTVTASWKTTAPAPVGAGSDQVDVTFQTGQIVPGTECTIMIGGVPTSVTSAQVMAAPSSVAINGSSALSVYLLDAYCNPVEGATVTFQDKTSPLTSATLSPAATTNADGLATGSVTDAAPDTVTVGGTYASPANGSGNLLTTPVAFIDSNVSTSLSSFSVSPAGPVTANGTDSYTGTVVARDGSNKPVTNLTAGDFTFPVLAGSPAASTTRVSVTSATQTTATSGVYTVQFTSTVADPSYAVSAQINGMTISSQQNVAIPFVAGPVNPTPIECTLMVGGVPTKVWTNTVLADPTSLTAGDTSNLSAYITDKDCNPIEGAAVSFTASSDATAETTQGLTDATGLAKGTVTDTTAETVLVGGTFASPAGSTPMVTGNLVPVEVTFVPGEPVDGPYSCGVKQGTLLTVDQPTRPVNTTATVNAYVTDKYCNPIPNHPVTFTVDKSAYFTTPSTPPIVVNTNATGNAIAKLTDATAETVSVTATGSTVGTVTVTFTAGVVDLAKSTFSVSPVVDPTGTAKTGWIVADGSAYYLGSVAAKDSDGNPVPGLTTTDFTFSPSSADVKVSSVTESASTPGTYEVKFTSYVADADVDVYANYQGSPIGVPTTTLPIPFKAGAASINPDGPGCTDPAVREGTNFKAAPLTLAVDESATGNAYVTDKNCNPVEGEVVTFTSDQTGATVAPASLATGADGHAVATITSPTALTANFGASIAAGTLPGSPKAVTWLAEAPAIGVPVITGPSDGSTVVTDKPTISGNGSTPGDTITVLDDNGNTVCTTTVGSNKQWSCTPDNPLVDGDHTLTATETDPAGNTGDKSDPVTVTVDTTPPVITKPSDGSTVVTSTPSIEGDAPDGTTVTVTDSATGDKPVPGCENVPVVNGKWSCTPDQPGLSDDDHALTPIVSDDNGGTNAGDPVHVTVDTTPPAITKPSDGSTVITATPPIEGNAPDGTTVTVTDSATGDKPVPGCENVPVVNGKWSCTPDQPGLTDDDHALTPIVSDTNGDTNKGDAVDVTVDTTPPVITGPKDGDLTNNNEPTITGEGTVPGDTITVTDKDGSKVCTATIQPDKSWSCTPSKPLTDDEHTLTATETDQSGNDGTPSDEVKVKVDTAKPSTPKLDNTNGSQVTGTGDPGNKVTIKDGDGKVIPGCETTVVDSTGHFKCVPTTPLKPDTTVTVTTTSPAGNESDQAKTIVLALEITLSDTKPKVGDPETITGDNFNPGETVHLSIDGKDMGPATADATGRVVFKFNVPSDLKVGQHTATLTGDQSGSVSANFNVTVIFHEGGSAVIASSAGLAASAGVLGLVGLWLATAVFRRRGEDAK